MRASMASPPPAWATISSWCVGSFAAWTLAWALLAPASCEANRGCGQHLQRFPHFYHVVSAAVLLALLGHELLGLVATYLGTQRAHALVPHLKGKCLPTLLLILMFGLLALSEGLFSRSWTLAHATPASRPVYTLQYLEWTAGMPITFLLAGYCGLGRPLHELSRPLLLTNTYIVLCWAAILASSAGLRWSLILVAAALYIQASLDMLNWSAAFERTAPKELPGRGLRPLLTVGLILHFSLYGMVYLGSVCGVFDAQTERKLFFALTFGAKIAFSAAFVLLRADEYHKTLTDVLQKVSVSNAGMISILRSSFDIILPCAVDAQGSCRLLQDSPEDLSKLERLLDVPVGDVSLQDLLAGEQPKADFNAYLQNVIRQAAGMTSSAQGWSAPAAQVLRSSFRRGAGQLEASLHLSVVPRSAASGKEWRLVAAIRVTAPEEELGTDHVSPVFEDFTRHETHMSDESTQPTSEAGSKLAIVADLKDLSKLGASQLLQSSSGQSALDDTSEPVSYLAPSWLDIPEEVEEAGAPELASQGSQSPTRQIAGSVFDDRLVGIWEGTTSQELGGYRQRIIFHPDGEALITVMGQMLSARCCVDSSTEPVTLDLEVRPTDSSPPLTIPYIFKIQGVKLHLCGPSNQHMRRPTRFHGAGLCLMERVDVHGDVHGDPESPATSPEPEPELSRETTIHAQEEPKVMAVPEMELPEAASEAAVSEPEPRPAGFFEPAPLSPAALTLLLAGAALALRGLR